MRTLLAAFAIAPAILLGAGAVGPQRLDRTARPPLTRSTPQHYGNLPLVFERNFGQVDQQVRFLTRSEGMTVFFTSSEAVMVLNRSTEETAVVRMKLAGGRLSGEASGLDKLPGISNYFIGNDAAKWHTDIPNYARIRYQSVYPGVDLVCYGKERQLEYDLIVAPGADPNQIELAWEGVDRIELNAAGDLVLTTRLGEVVQKRPRVEQEIGGRLVEVKSKYRMTGGKRVGFELAAYDRKHPLRIDPVVLAYSTYLGGSASFTLTTQGDRGAGIAVDSSGSAYVTGLTSSIDFPTNPSSLQPSRPGLNSAYVVKFSPSGNALVYSTYLGGSIGTQGLGIAVDGSGEAYVTGSTGSTDFPTTKGAFQTTRPVETSAFVTKLNAAGNSLIFSTYLGGASVFGDVGQAIAVDSTGSAYVAGQTNSQHFPVSDSAYQKTNKAVTNTGFVTKFSSTGAFVYSTYLGGSKSDSANGIGVDSSGHAYVVGFTNSFDFPTTPGANQAKLLNTFGDGFVTKLSAAGDSLIFSTYLGGSGITSPQEYVDSANAVAVDGQGNAYVTGHTGSLDFPTTPSAYQPTLKSQLLVPETAYVAKFGSAGTLAWASYLGGTNGLQNGYGIAVDSAGSPYIAGSTTSSDFPVQQAYQQSLRNGYGNAFITKMTPDGSSVVYSTYLGGSEGEADGARAIAVDAAGAAYVTGVTTTADFPIVTPAVQPTNKSTYENGFVSKLTYPGGGSTSTGIAVTVTTNPPGLALTIDGASYTAPATVNWNPGDQHTLSVASPQGTGTRNVFSKWSDGGAQSHTVTAPTAATTYTASFTTQYLLTTSVAPAGSGSVAANPTSTDGYYNSGASVQLTASPSASFAKWSGDASGTSNPTTLTMNAPKAVIANFATATPLPDLVVTALSGPTTATAGAQIAVTSMVANQGNADAGQFRTEFYFSTSANFTSSSISTDYGCTLSSLAAGASHTCNGNITVPKTLTNGTWYLLAVADPTNQVTESNKNNNFRAADSGPVTIGAASVAITVTTTPPGLAVMIDGTSYTASTTVNWIPGDQHTLNVASPQGTGTRSVFSKWSDGGAQSHTVTAPSSATTYTASFNTQYLLTTSVAPAGSGTIAASPTSTDGYYSSGASVQLTASPSATFTNWSGDATGTVNPVSLTMNAAKSVTANFGSAALPDLAITALSTSNAATPGGQINVSVTVANQGNADAGAFPVEFYFASSATASYTNATDSGSNCPFTALAAGTSHTCSAGAAVPASLASGTWYLLAVADPNNRVAESNKNNNTRAADSGPIVVGGGSTTVNVSALTVLLASSKQVQLAWPATSGATSYQVQRKSIIVTNTGIAGTQPAVTAGAYSTVMTVTGTSATDTSIDPSTTYTYCVMAAGGGSCSNEVTVGPPPFGFNIAVPSTPDSAYNAGVLERMDLDANGDPAMAYLMIDPNGDGDESDDTLYFVSWNRAQYSWNSPVMVAVTGPGYTGGPAMPTSLARDPATGTWGLAYTLAAPDGSSTIMLATSPDGVAWKSQSISGDPYYGWLCAPSLVLWNGSFYAAYLTDSDSFAFPQGSGAVYVTGNVGDAAAKWTSQAVPFPGDYTSLYYTISLALDSNHAPGIAFNAANDTYEGVVFWRPGTSTSTLVAHNDGYTTNDNPAISLAFFGTEPRIATDAEWNYASYDPDSEPAAVWTWRAANPAGTAWLTAVQVPADNANVLDSPWITNGSQGQTAIAMASNQDPEGQGMVCGFPKIARSSDFLVFQTCAPAPVNNPSFAPNNVHPVLRFGGNDKLWLAFNNNDATGDIGIGLVLWREQ